MRDQQMVEVAVAEADGAVLDWMVAKIDTQCDGLQWQKPESGKAWLGFGRLDGIDTPCAFLSATTTISERIHLRRGGMDSYSPSTDWSQGGPLIDKHRPSLYPHPHNEWESCIPETMDDQFNEKTNEIAEAPTALVAAMRAIVFAKLGDHVSVPAELVEGA